MKPIYFSMIFFLLIGCKTEKSSQQTSQEPAPKKVVITGKITHPTVPTINFSSESKIGDEMIKSEAAVAEDGTFKTTIELTKPSFFVLKHQEYARFYLMPGDSLHITLDTDEFDETIVYTGTGAIANNFLKERFLDAEVIPMDELYKLDASAFLAQINTDKKLGETKIAKLKNDLPSPFFSMASQENLYDWAVKQLNYPSYHKHFAKTEELGVISDDFLKELDANKPELLSSTAYREFISAYSDHKFPSDPEATPAESLAASFTNIGKAFSDKEIIQYLRTDKLYEHIKYRGIGGVQSTYDQFQKEVSNAAYKEKVNEAYAEWSDLATGKIAPDFTTSNLDGDEVKLSDLKGNYVYIDVWATWCGPCKREIPHLEELQETYKDAPISFVSVSIDENKGAWERMVAEKEMKGIQLFIDGAWNSTLTEAYNIHGIPRFMLIDREGKIIDPNTERPSGKIKSIFNKLEGVSI